MKIFFFFFRVRKSKILVAYTEKKSRKWETRFLAGRLGRALHYSVYLHTHNCIYMCVCLVVVVVVVNFSE